MIIVGLTGGIATGKSTVSSSLARFGEVTIVDADLIAREVVEPGKPALKKIVSQFGTVVLCSDGHLDRKAMGDIIFNDPISRLKLNNITHPYIQRTMLWQTFLAFLKGKKYVILDSPLLFESGKLYSYMNACVVVYCDEDTQRTRLMERNQLSEQEANERIGSQMPLKVKCKMADFVINNSKSREQTIEQTVEIHKKLLTLSRVKGVSRNMFIFIVVILILAIVYISPKILDIFIST
ncbi:Dephospho-CoA kinase domain-containing protein [Oopsacas minuta]|uniref:Dephospho-CoA kinase domain-containing protein n=1 Tax=Oopsacas minuta TaxID=111878 RepID=A0AAV7KGZ3_9METZ|nr:Dephospho-CoA kinase domain-containing protein [Oopsacas minuta]